LPQHLPGAQAPSPDGPLVRIRALTAGVPLGSFSDAPAVESALDALCRSKRRFEEAGYEVQTLRVATPALVGVMSPRQRQSALADVTHLDGIVADRNAVLSIGPVLTLDRSDADLVPWAVDLATATSVTSFSVTVASLAGGSHRRAAAEAARIIAALSRVAPDGRTNFRFAAAAAVPAGTPFFPVAYHEGSASLSIGLESPRLVRDALTSEGGGFDGCVERLRVRFDAALAPIAALAESCAREEGRRYVGIDPSPAPGMDSSIGEAIEALTGTPFGGASTLEACASITGALKQLNVLTCGYAGVMLPVLEDPVLARRAAEGRFGLRDLLLFSSVCGTGLDVVPLPGDTPVEVLARIIADVSALSVRLRKPLSARLFPIPGKRAGEAVSFDDPLLTTSVALPPE
jgi:uncharacterized protein (UPF0210 family)